MSRTTLAPFLALLVPMLTVSACLEGAKDTGEDDTGTDTDTTSDITAVSATFGDTSLEVVITGGSGSYNFGMAETGAGDQGWYGEDCSDGNGGGFNLCHAGVSASFSLNRVEAPAEVVEGYSTLFLVDAVDPGDVTIFVEDAVTGDCVVIGHDLNYYDGFQCSPLPR